MANVTLEKFGVNNRKQMSEWNSWRAMWSRCTDKAYGKYHLYGGRGISVCERWRDFYSFMEDMGRKPSSKHSIERIDRDGDYCPENCVWATQTQQMRNTSNNLLLTLNGETKPAAEWAELIGFPKDVIYRRKRRGWSDERALTQAPREMEITSVTFNGQTKSLRGWSIALGLNLTTLISRFNKGWPVEKVLSQSTFSRWGGSKE